MSAATDEIGKSNTKPVVAKSAGTKPLGTTPGARQRGQGRVRWLRLLLMLVLPLVLVVGAGWFYLTSGRYISTDDAFVQADVAMISADVSGRVVQLAVHDNEKVTKGQLLFRLDDRPFRIALEHAQAELAAAKLGVDSSRAMYRQRLADLRAAQDTLGYQQREVARQQQLFAAHVTPQTKVDQVRHDYQMATAQVAAAQQQLASTLANLGGNPDLPLAQNPNVEQAQAQVDQAALNLSYTTVRAPADGIVNNASKLPVGQYLSAANPAFSLVETDQVWIEANYKETELTHMRPGQAATIDIDTYPDHSFHSHVQSIGSGTGSEFSVLPPQNATGNWVKVVQRIPVRLVIDHPDPDRPLRAGMSATIEVDTGYQRPLYLTLKSLFGHSDRAEAAVRH